MWPDQALLTDRTGTSFGKSWFPSVGNRIGVKSPEMKLEVTFKLLRGLCPPCCQRFFHAHIPPGEYQKARINVVIGMPNRATPFINRLYRQLTEIEFVQSL